MCLKTLTALAMTLAVCGYFGFAPDFPKIIQNQLIDCFQLEMPCQSIKTIDFDNLGPIKVAMYDPKVDYYISGWWDKDEWWSHDITVSLIQYMNNHPGDIIEVGANIGSILLPLAKNEEIANRNTTIHAFEANKHNERMLQASVALNQFNNVDIHFCAATNETHGEIVHSNSVVGNMGCSKTTVSHNTITSGLEVPTCTIDKALQSSRFGSLDTGESRKVSLMKLDCEGCEAKALLGAERILTEDKPAVFMEVTEKYLRKSGVTWRDLMLFMTSKGYHLFDFWHNYIGHRYNLTDPTHSDFQGEDDETTPQSDVWWLHEDTIVHELSDEELSWTRTKNE